MSARVRRSWPRGPLIRWTLVAVLLVISAATLTRFPANSYHDENEYGSMAYEWLQHGRVLTPELSWYYNTQRPEFQQGDAWHPRLQIGLFILLTKALPQVSPFLRARVTSFIFGLAAVLLCGLLGKAWKVDGSWLALVLACHEHFLAASHSFRPEIVLFAANVVMLILAGYQGRISTRNENRYWAGRGLINFLVVAAHANGITSVAVNTALLFGEFKSPRFRKKIIAYGVGSGASLLLFYFWQIFPVGGLHVALKQLDVFTYGIPGASILAAVQHEMTARWRGEVSFIDGSLIAMTFRIVSYATVFISAFFIRREKAMAIQKVPARFLAFAIVIAYTFLVGDKIEIQIAEMLPFFAIVLATALEFPKFDVGVPLPLFVIIPNLALSLQHMSAPPTPKTVEPAVVRGFVEKLKPDLLVGASSHWFDFTDLHFCADDLKWIPPECDPAGKRILWIGDHERSIPGLSWARSLMNCAQMDIRVHQVNFKLYDCGPH